MVIGLSTAAGEVNSEMYLVSIFGRWELLVSLAGDLRYLAGVCAVDNDRSFRLGPPQHLHTSLSNLLPLAGSVDFAAQVAPHSLQMALSLLLPCRYRPHISSLVKAIGAIGASRYGTEHFLLCMVEGHFAAPLCTSCCNNYA